MGLTIVLASLLSLFGRILFSSSLCLYNNVLDFVLQERIVYERWSMISCVLCMDICLLSCYNEHVGRPVWLPFFDKKTAPYPGQKRYRAVREVTKRTAPITHWQPALRAKKCPTSGQKTLRAKEMTLDCLTAPVKGHFHSFLVSNIFD